MSVLKELPIRHYALGIYDGPHATPPESMDGPVFLGIKNVTDDGRIDLTEIRHISQEHYPKWIKRVTPSTGDIVLSYEATLHRYAVIPEGFVGCLGRRIALIRPDTSKVDSRYLLYYLLSPLWRRTVESFIITGATVDRIPIEKLPDFPVKLHSLPIQQRIAKIISTYDYLIENNLKRIALLEESARLLYREWFVRLRFPGYEHTHFVDCMPEGWEKVKVGSLLSRISRKKKIPKDSYVEYGDIPCVDQSAEFIGGFTDDQESLHTEPLPIIVFGDHTRILKYIDFPFASGADGTQLIYPNRQDVSTEYLYFALKAVDLSNYFYARHFKFLKELEVFIPCDTLIRGFTEFARANFAQTKTLRTQNEKLNLARDLLLPRLMNGEIEV